MGPSGKRIRGSHILPVVPVIRGCLSMEEPNSFSPFRNPLPPQRSSQERTSGPSRPKRKVEKSLSHGEKCYSPQDASATTPVHQICFMGLQRKLLALISTFAAAAELSKVRPASTIPRESLTCVWESSLGLCSHQFFILPLRAIC